MVRRAIQKLFQEFDFYPVIQSPPGLGFFLAWLKAVQIIYFSLKIDFFLHGLPIGCCFFAMLGFPLRIGVDSSPFLSGNPLGKENFPASSRTPRESDQQRFPASF